MPHQPSPTIVTFIRWSEILGSDFPKLRIGVSGAGGSAISMSGFETYSTASSLLSEEAPSRYRFDVEISTIGLHDSLKVLVLAEV